MLVRALSLLAVMSLLLFSCQSEQEVVNESLAQPQSELVSRLQETFDNEVDLPSEGLESRTHTTVLDFLLADPDYSILIEAASRIHGLPEILDNPRLSVTLFAPTNGAFVQFLADNGL